MKPDASYIFLLIPNVKTKKIDYNSLIIYGYAFILEEKDDTIILYHIITLKIHRV